jgi:hypothetical protein
MCHGNVIGQFPIHQRIGDKIIHVRYHERIAQLGNPEWRSDADPESPILFRADHDVEGMVMPIVWG